LKNILPYLIGGIALVALIALVVSAPLKRDRKLDERITLRQKDKIPYGTFVAHHLLTSLFPHAFISTDKREPCKWNHISAADTNQVVFLIAKSFEPEEYELKRLADFVQKGNYVFIVANSLSYETARYMGVSSSERYIYVHSEDSLNIALNNPPFKAATTYMYPGKRFDSYFTGLDTAKAVQLGNDQYGNSNFIQLQAGRGKLFIHLAPLTFSNYFILHKNNTQYFQKVLSVIPPHVDKVLWNEYFLTKRKIKNESEPDVLSVLWQYPSFRWALITAVATLLLYALMEMRRRQRFIPVLQKPVNDSLDFVRTMGRLYYDRKDHQNLSKKMASFFLDHVRTRYKVAAHTLDDAFVQELHAKSGYGMPELQRIVSFIHYTNDNKVMSEHQLADFYKHLESFYQNT
jgi:hypothetical protein